MAARISGCNTGKLVFRHLIPNILPQFLVYVSTGVASSIIMVSSFAFLGLGLPSGTPEWGAMLNDARTALYSHPELLIYPGLCIFVTAAGFNLFGEALRDIPVSYTHLDVYKRQDKCLCAQAVYIGACGLQSVKKIEISITLLSSVF